MDKTADRRPENHFTREELNQAWPNLTEGQSEHLNHCSDCQQLVKDHFPVLYVGPVHDIIYKEKSANKASEYILEELESRFKSGCFDIFAGSLFLSSLTCKNVNHVQGCQTCRRLIDYLSRSGGPFATAFGGLHQSFLKLVEMNLEIAELRNICRKDGLGIENLHVKNCWENCLNPIDAGRDQVILMPRKDEQTEHHENCVHCQLVMQYHHFQWHHDSYECLDAKTWRLFPVYSKDDQRELERHAFTCYFCSSHIVNRIGINFQRDRQAFQKLTTEAPYLRNAKSFIRNARRPVGDFISSWRFHFGGDGPFATRHPWAVWDLEDRMVKLVKAEDLSDKEDLYRRALIGEVALNEVYKNFSSSIKVRL